MLMENSRTGIYTPKFERFPFIPVVVRQYAMNKMMITTRESRMHFHSALRIKAALFLW
jgi:hypothetical protein